MFEHLKGSEAGIQFPASPPPDCGDPVGALKTMFVDLVMGRRLAAGQAPALRPVFLKAHGGALGAFAVRRDLPQEMRIGIFGHAGFPAVVRFSSDQNPRKPDLKSTVGVSVKLIGVPGRKFLHPDAPTCDFLLQNHDVFFVDTAKDFCEFTYAGVVGGNYDPYLAAHPVTAHILKDMEKVVPSVLTATYWGLLPHRLGGLFVKYKLAPAAPGAGPAGPALDPASLDNYLYIDLKARLRQAPAEFHFYVQPRTDEAAMLLDKATVRWDETASPPVHVATLTLPRQNVDAPGLAGYGEGLAFNIWQTLPEHEPQGSIAAARKVVYFAAAELRRTENHAPTEEPTKPLPEPTPPSSPDNAVVRAEIHPAIGVARVGNSPNEFFLGPEVPDPESEPPGCYRDRTGALKRQAVRFRVYGYNKDGDVVAELTADNAVLEWTVHVANKKAAWYNFTLAMDVPEINDPKVEPARRRNSEVEGADRQKQLVIDPGPRSIHGRDTGGSTYRFDTGKFMGAPVYLGELKTDEDGRLIFLGGHGVSRSATGARPYDFANNDGWHDDICDGPVSARVWVGDREITVESAWVTVGPPNYAPELKSVRTMYDLFEDLPFQAGADPGEVSFTRHIQPILERMCALQWVNLGFADQFGWRAPNEFVRPDYLARLATRLVPSDPANPTPQERANAAELAQVRKQVFNNFRDYTSNNGWRGLWPWVYGDAMDVAGGQRRDLALSNLQLARLKAWADGRFTADYDPKRKASRKLADFDLAERPNTLTEAALSFCLADAFHPGCEVTWVVRATYLYRPLPPNPKDAARLPLSRFKVRPASLPEPDYGDVLDPRVALSSSGPLNSLGPGDLTRWMAVPWQTDTASCRAGYPPDALTPSTPTFWPARVPNHVLTEEDYEKLMDDKLVPEKRWEAFRRRVNWLRDLGGGFESILRMVTEFGLLGVVERRKGPGSEFPDVVLVEVKPKAVAPAAATAALASGDGELSAPDANGVPEDPSFPKVKRLLRQPAGRQVP